MILQSGIGNLKTFSNAIKPTGNFSTKVKKDTMAYLNFG